MTTFSPRPARFRAALALTLAIACGQAVAGGPANDDWIGREPITTLPFSQSLPLVNAASVEATDPRFFCRLGTIDATGVAPAVKTVWYTYATGGEAEYVKIETGGYDTLLAVYAGDPVAGFAPVAGGCNDNGGSANGSRLNGLRLEPDTSYSIVVAAFDASVSASVLQFDMASARLYAVSKVADTRDGVCDADCSLREAIDASNADPGAVVVPPGSYVLTRAGANEDANSTGDLDVRQGMGIYGSDVAPTLIDGNDIDRVLHIDPAGGGAYSVVLVDVRITNGSTSGSGGGIANPVSAFANADFVQLERVRVDANSAATHGGGAQLAGTSWLRETSVEGNLATLDGGGLYLHPPAAQDAVRTLVQRSTLSANQSNRTGTGGGGGLSSAHDVVIEASTISGNSTNANGGGTRALRSFTLVDSTVAFNVASAGGGSAGNGGGIAQETDGAGFVVRNGIVAGNRVGSGAGTPRDCLAVGATPSVSAFDSLIQVPGGCAVTGTSNVTGVDPQLLPLGDNGGPGRTHLLAETSPAIDTGAATCLATDHIGTKRPRDGDGDALRECDRGAVEQITDLLLRAGFEGP